MRSLPRRHPIGDPRVAVVLGAISGLFGCVPVGAFSCIDDSECGAAGSCELDGYCASVDDGCESGRRYSRYAPQAVAGRCVPLAAGTTGTGGSSGLGTVTTLDGSTANSTLQAETSTASAGTAESSGSDTVSTTGPSSDCLPIGRDPAPPVLLYDFCEGDGTTVDSITATSFPLDFENGAIGNGFLWVDDGLRLNGDFQDAMLVATAARSP
jgi:hypothetical protein